MNAAAYFNQHLPDQGAGLSGPVFQSALLHIVVIALGMITLPMVARDPVIVPPPVSVDIVDIDALTQAKKAASRPKAPEIAKPAPPASKPMAPKVVAQKPPDMLSPRPPDTAEKVAGARAVESVPPLKRTEIAKPAPPKPKETSKPAAEKKDDFQSLLRNLMPDSKIEAARESADDPALSDEESLPVPRLGERITVSEEDALRRQLGRCWNVMAGAKYAEDLAVEVKVIVNPDRTVQRASILDQGRYGRDPHYRAAADAALRALRNPLCSPLALPPEKYESWKTTIIRFDPREML